MNHTLTSALILHTWHLHGSVSLSPQPQEKRWLVLGPFFLSATTREHQSCWWENRESLLMCPKFTARFNLLPKFGLKQKLGGLLLSQRCMFAQCEWHFGGKWNDSLVRRWAKVKLEECDGNEKVSRGVKNEVGEIWSCSSEFYQRFIIWMKPRVWVWLGVVFVLVSLLFFFPTLRSFFPSSSFGETTTLSWKHTEGVNECALSQRRCLLSLWMIFSCQICFDSTAAATKEARSCIMISP